MVCQNSALRFPSITYNRLKNQFPTRDFSGGRIPHLDRNLMMMETFSTCHSKVNQILHIVIFQKVNKLRHPRKMTIHKHTIHREAFVCHGLTILSIEKRLFAAGKNPLQTGVRFIITQYQMPRFAAFCRTLRIQKIMP